MAFSFKFYKLLLSLLIILGVSFLILGYFLDEDFFLQYSVDKELKPQTIDKIHKIQDYSYMSGLLFLALSALVLIFKRLLIKLIKKWADIIQNILLFLGVIVLFLILGEVILRVLIAEETSRFGFGPGSLKFDKKYVHLNEEGFRDYDYPLLKEENTIRIIGLGDSFTYGSGIKNVDDVYFKNLEKMLNQGDTVNYEVLNFAKPGLNTRDEIQILKDNALKYDPDIIILGYVLNDFDDVEHKTKCKSKEHTIPLFGFWLRNFSYLYYFIETRFNKIIENTNFECTYGEYLNNVFMSEKNREYNFGYFEQLSEISKENNAKLGVVTFPMIYDLQEYPFTEAHAFIKEAGKKYDFKVIDLLAYYQKYTEKELIVSIYDMHPNELGHEIAAKAIYGALIKENYIK